MDYAKILDIPCVFSSNGDGFLFHDRTATDEDIENELDLDSFPTPEQLWGKYKKYKGIETPAAEKIAAQDYYFGGTSRKPRYYLSFNWFIRLKSSNKEFEFCTNGDTGRFKPSNSVSLKVFLFAFHYCGVPSCRILSLMYGGLVFHY